MPHGASYYVHVETRARPNTQQANTSTGSGTGRTRGVPCRVLRRYAVNGRCTASETAETARRRDGNLEPLTLMRAARRATRRRSSGRRDRRRRGVITVAVRGRCAHTGLGPTSGRDATADSISEREEPDRTDGGLTALSSGRPEPSARVEVDSRCGMRAIHQCKVRHTQRILFLRIFSILRIAYF